MSEIPFNNGQANGYYKKYYESEKVKEEGKLENGKIVGLPKAYDEFGKEISVSRDENGNILYFTSSPAVRIKK